MSATEEMKLAREILKALQDGLQGKNWQCEQIDGYQYEDSDRIEFRLYHADGYCVNILGERMCEPDEIKDVAEMVLDDGWMYEVCSPDFDGFKDATIEQVANWIKEAKTEK